MKTTSFNGMYLENAITRRFNVPDPANPQGKGITQRKKFGLITGLVIGRVAGHGNAERTNEPYLTLAGQYGPFRQARLTIAGDQAINVVKDSLLLKDNVEKTKPELPLIKERTVEAVVTPMKGYGFLVEELYLVKEDGSKETIIGSKADQTAEGEGENEGATKEYF